MILEKITNLYKHHWCYTISVVVWVCISNRRAELTTQLRLKPYTVKILALYPSCYLIGYVKKTICKIATKSKNYIRWCKRIQRIWKKDRNKGRKIKWSIVAKIALFIGKDGWILLRMSLFMKKHIWKRWLISMVGLLGDKKSNIVHHLVNMKKECKIVEMKLIDRQYFTPDTLENAKSKNFASCEWCILNQ